MKRIVGLIAIVLFGVAGFATASDAAIPVVTGTWAGSGKVIRLSSNSVLSVTITASVTYQNGRLFRGTLTSKVGTMVTFSGPFTGQVAADNKVNITIKDPYDYVSSIFIEAKYAVSSTGVKTINGIWQDLYTGETGYFTLTKK